MLPNAILSSGMPASDYPPRRVLKKCHNRAIFETSTPIVGPVSHCLGTKLHTGICNYLADILTENLGSAGLHSA